MKVLESVSLTRLTLLEFGQHAKSIYRDIANLNSSGTLIVDPVYKSYLVKFNDSTLAYDKAMVQISKSDETAKIVVADQVRDRSFSALSRYLSVFEASEVDAEVDAHKSLSTLLKKYKGLQKWNLEEETNGIDNLVADLNSSKYLPSVTLINMNSYVTRLTSDNEAFKIIFDSRTQEAASKEVFDVRVLRANLKMAYNDMSGYVFTMAKALDNDEFNKSLNVINAVRKYYSDLLARRKPATKTTPEVPIPPME
jgi:Family of unknown function (DUF6261)